MSDTKFTPGPWDKYDLIIGKMVDGRHRYTPIASIYESESGYEGEDQSNANLIAAAPDLYEVLSEAMERGGSIQMCLYQKAIDALSKARGET